MNSKLMDLAAEYRALAERLMDMDLPEEVVTDTLEGEALPLEQKCDSVVWVAWSMDGLAAQIREREKELAARRRALEARAARLRDFVKEAMKLAGISLVETPNWKLRVKKSAPAVVIDASTQVPVEYMRFPEPPPPEIDKALIKETLLAAQKAQEKFQSGKAITAEEAAAIAKAKDITFAHLEQGDYLDVR